MNKYLLSVILFSLVSVISAGYSLAHHNANYPDGVDPAFIGIDLYSYHNDAIDYSLEMQDGDNVLEVTMDGTLTQTSSTTAEETGTDNSRTIRLTE